MPPAIEVGATVTALIYVVLAGRNSSWCWPFAFVSSILWAYQVYVAYDLYFDAALNLFYAVMAVVGLWRWAQVDAPAAGASSQIKITSVAEHSVIIGGGALLSVVCAVLAKAYTEAALVEVDAVTTVFSVIGTFLLIQRRRSAWMYLLIMDVVYVWLYWERGSPTFSVVFVLYSLLAVVGYRRWSRILEMQSEQPIVV